MGQPFTGSPSRQPRARLLWSLVPQPWRDTPARAKLKQPTPHACRACQVEELNEPSGWVTILPPREETAEGGVLRTHFIQVAVLANHQNGRDTHIRQIKIYTPRRLMGQHMGLPEFNSVSFQQYACLR